MHVAIRTDANNTVGTGHLHRCLNIGRELVARGHEVTFLIGRNSSIGRMNQPNTTFGAVQIDDSVQSFTVGGSRSVTPIEEVVGDARSTSTYLQSKTIDWLIVDHYSLGDEWVSEVKTRANCRVLAIDDIGRAWSNVDLLLDSALEANVLYSSMSASTGGLLGPSYVPLNPAYKTSSGSCEGNDERRVLTVFFGGADSPNATGSTLKALSSRIRDDLLVRVVVGELNANKNSLKAEFSSPNFDFCEPADSLYEYLQTSDAFIGGGGTTTWERLCLGVPSATISIAENQIKMSEELARAGCLIYLGATSQVSEDAVRSSVDRLLDDQEFRDDVALHGRLLVDGYGSSRICEAMAPTNPSELTLRPVQPNDCLLLFRWANDAAVRQSSLDPRPILWSTHRDWFGKFLAHPDKRMFIAELNGMPVAQIRFEPSEGRLRLSYLVDRHFRGKGIGRRIAELGIREIRRGTSETIVAEVREENEASLRVFRALGFREAGSTTNGVLVFLLD